MHTEILFAFDEWAVFLFLAALLFAVMRTAYVIGRRHSARYSERGAGQIANVAGLLIGFFSLILGFTFCIALERYNARMEMLEKEVDDTGTLFQMTELLAEPFRGEAQGMLVKYAEFRHRRYDRSLPREERQAIAARVGGILDVLWENGMRAARTPGGLSPALADRYIGTLSAFESDRFRRNFAIDFHVPEPIIWFLIIIAMLGAGACGYANGLHQVANPVMRVTLLLGILLTIFIIIDLDRPHGGIVRVNQSPMGRLAEQLRAAAARPGAMPAAPAAPAPRKP